MSQQIRVLHMIGSLNVGGSQSMILNLYRVINRSVVQFDFIVDHPNELFYLPEVKEMGAKVFFMPSFYGSNIFQVIRAWDTFFDNHREYKIIHIHVRSYASIIIPIAKKYGLITIMHSHSTSNGVGVLPFIKDCLQIPLRWQADYFLSCSREAGLWLFGKKIVNSDKFHILKNAIDVNQYVFNMQIRNNYRKELNLENKIVYINIGRLHPSKNQRFLLDIFPKIIKYEPNSVLLIVGEGELRKDLIQQIKKLNLEHYVFLLGNRDDVPKLLQASDCFLFPSIWEGLGIAAIEAQVTGLPCICNDQVPKDVSITKTCFFISTTSPEKWIETAISLPKERNMEGAKAALKSGYDISQTANWLIHFYIKINEGKYA